MASPQTPTMDQTGQSGSQLHGPELLGRMVEIIVREVDPLAIILFGSYARDDARPDSDVDLLVIAREPFGPGRSRIKEAARLYRALGDVPASKDLLLYSQEEVEGWRNTRNHVVARAYREGRLLYGDA
jgi:predicted nucleotidyltransferase